MVPRTFPMLMLAGAVLRAPACAAAPEVTVYVTVPLGVPVDKPLFGLRFDRHSTPSILANNLNSSPLTRRALLDLQLGADQALRLQIDHRFTYDFGQRTWLARAAGLNLLPPDPHPPPAPALLPGSTRVSRMVVGPRSSEVVRIAPRTVAALPEIRHAPRPRPSGPDHAVR